MPNPVVHFEISGRDGEALRRFYRGAFGWEVNADNPMDYGVVEPQGEGIGGGITAGDAPSAVFYVQVDDMRAALDAVEAHGGRTVVDVSVIPGVVTWALFADPEGNVVGLVHSETPPGA